MSMRVVHLGTAILLFTAGTTGAYVAGCASACRGQGSTSREPVTDLPVVCTLPEGDLKDHQKNVLQRMSAHVVETKVLDSGLALRFTAGDGLFAELAEIIEAERECCAFLKYKLEVLPNNGPIWLELTGPEGTRAFLQSALGVSK